MAALNSPNNWLVIQNIIYASSSYRNRYSYFLFPKTLSISYINSLCPAATSTEHLKYHLKVKLGCLQCLFDTQASLVILFSFSGKVSIEFLNSSWKSVLKSVHRNAEGVHSYTKIRNLFFQN